MPARRRTRSTDVSSAMLRAGAIAGGGVVPLAGVAGAVLRSGRAGVNAAAGAFAAVAFLTIGVMAIGALTRNATSVIVPVALGLYLTVVALLFAVLHRLEGWSGLERVPLALGAVAAVLAWQLGASLAVLRGRHLVYGGEERR